MADFSLHQPNSKRPVASPGVIIVCAKYGPHDCNEVDSRTQDVTDLIRAHQEKLREVNPSGGPFHLAVSNHALGGDCAPHLVKTCRVWYQDFADGPLRVKAAPEEGVIVIPPPARAQVEVLEATAGGVSGPWRDVTAVVRQAVASGGGTLRLVASARALGLLPGDDGGGEGPTLRVTCSRYAGGPVRTVEVLLGERPVEVEPLPLGYALSISKAILHHGWTEGADVTVKLRELLSDDGSVLRLASPSALLPPSRPCLSASPPRLLVRYRRRPTSSSDEEEESLEWPRAHADGQGPLELHARPEPAPPRLEVVQAIYGGYEKPGFLSSKPGPFRSLDVTKTVSQEVSDEGRLRLLVDNSSFGGDPIIGVKKACTVWYRTRPGWPLQTVCVDEGDVLDLHV